MPMTAEQKKKEVADTLKYLYDTRDEWFVDYPLVRKEGNNSEAVNSTENFFVFLHHKYVKGVHESSLNWTPEFVKLNKEEALVVDALANGKQLDLVQHGFTEMEHPDTLKKYIVSTIENAYKQL